MKHRESFLLGMAVLALLLVVGGLVSVGVGAVSLSPRVVWTTLVAGLRGEEVDSTFWSIVWNLRVPRIILGALIGAGLATSGAAFQGLFRNPLADPYVVGASSGAALGATLAIVFGASWGAVPFARVPLSAFAGALVAVGLVYTIAEVGGSAPVIALVLAGTALSTFLSAVVSLLMMVSDQTMHEIYAWLLGGLSGRSWQHLRAGWAYLTFGSASIALLARPLDALAMGDETARSLGLSIGRSRAAIVLVATLTTAAAVAAAGVIGFVGLIAPHIARLLFGAGHARVIPASALLGALLMLLADDVARTVLAPMELPVGIVTAIVGGPFFLYLLKARQRELGGRG